MIAKLDRLAQIGMALGIALIFQPWWPGDLKWGFFTTLTFTVLHIVTSHRVT